MTAAASSIAGAHDRDAIYMRRALALAERGWGHTAPNPMVGAVVVAGDEIVGEGYHVRYGEAHAEVNALTLAGERARGATVYVTLEPCAHFGKTPPCTNALIAAGVARVVIAAADPSAIARDGAARLREVGIQVDIGVEANAARELNAAFFNATCSSRPWVTLKLAMSADGAIADPTGEQRWITRADARREVHHQRANADAIAVGIGTVLADDPHLDVRDVPAPRVPSTRVIFDSRLRTPDSSFVWRTSSNRETIFIARPGQVSPQRLGEARDLGALVLLPNTLRDALEWIRDLEIRSLYVEGGATLAGAFLREGLVDRLVIFRAPMLLGDRALKAFAHAPVGFEASLEQTRVVDERRFGDDVMTTYALHEVPCSPA
ncbi:MAG TPA: bifunctional diaminohydroxyphosphoribosylaminopyrimidine deaminase/5-amino-6-(5-phosphoribosylamino)uracil reductase RibD [Gemmatimonadaceae bacterium]